MELHEKNTYNLNVKQKDKNLPKRFILHRKEINFYEDKSYEHYRY